MENYLVDRETLGKFVDELIKKKPLPVDNADELNQLREKSIRELDDRVMNAIFDRLDDGQVAELNRILDENSEDEATIKDFFDRAGINLEELASNAAKDFAADFMEGK